jgi:hypothetical protein
MSISQEGGKEDRNRKREIELELQHGEKREPRPRELGSIGLPAKIPIVCYAWINSLASFNMVQHIDVTRLETALIRNVCNFA